MYVLKRLVVASERESDVCIEKIGGSERMRKKSIN